MTARTVYYSIHPSATHLPLLPIPVGTLIELVVFDETRTSLGCKVVKPESLAGHVWRFIKAPGQFFGDALNGPFSTPARALARLAGPIPTFSKEGKTWYRN